MSVSFDQARDEDFPEEIVESGGTVSQHFSVNKCEIIGAKNYHANSVPLLLLAVSCLPPPIL